MATTACNLDPAGLAPSAFINPSVVPDASIAALAAQAPRVYGCVQFLAAGTAGASAAGKWFCAVRDPSAERASQGRPAQCAVNATESVCTAAWAMSSQAVPAAAGAAATLPTELFVQGCVNDGKGFACSAPSTARRTCTPQGLSSSGATGSALADDPSTSSSSSTGLIVGLVVGAAVLLIAGIGFFVFKRKRRAGGAGYDASKMVVAPRAGPGAGAGAATAAGISNVSSATLHSTVPPTAAAESNPPPPGPVARIPVLSSAAADIVKATPQAYPSPQQYAARAPSADFNGGQTYGRPSIDHAAAVPLPGSPMPLPSLHSGGPGSSPPNHYASPLAQPMQQQQQGYDPQQQQQYAERQQLLHVRQTSSDVVSSAGSSASHASAAAAASAASLSPYHGPAPGQQQQQLSPYGGGAATSPPAGASSLSPSTNFSFIAPRPSMTLETALPTLAPSPRPSFDSSRPSGSNRPSGLGGMSTTSPANGPSPALSAVSYASNFSTDEEVFPRPYRTYVNMEATAPVVQAEALAGPAGVVPALPAQLQSLSRTRHTAPSDDAVVYHAFDFKLPLTAALRTQKAAEMCATKANLPGYAIDDLVATYEGFQLTMREMVAQSFAHADSVADAHHAGLARNVFASVTGGAPVPPATGLAAGEPSQAAFLSRLMNVLLTDLFIALTNPLAVPGHLALLKKHLPEMKKDLKPPAGPAAHKEAALHERAPAAGLSAHLLFVAMDHCLSSPSLSSPLMAHLRPVLHHARATLTDQFHAHGLPPPAPEVLDDLLVSFLDWFLRLKREYPGVGLYTAIENAPLDPQLAVVEGGSVRPEFHPVVAFTTCFGLWDGSIGAVGFFARVWTKPELVQ
ncbi:hypothetical protein H9P43_007423 [Blastocladiella emersonii ATCC 22665]|nr:hypothetical protein H9P43_007423 [Blastocladiella emersonii ATCC 22665]